MQCQPTQRAWRIELSSEVRSCSHAFQSGGGRTFKRAFAHIRELQPNRQAGAGTSRIIPASEWILCHLLRALAAAFLLRHSLLSGGAEQGWIATNSRQARSMDFFFTSSLDVDTGASPARIGRRRGSPRCRARPAGVRATAAGPPSTGAGGGGSSGPAGGRGSVRALLGCATVPAVGASWRRLLGCHGSSSGCGRGSPAPAL